MTKSYFELRKRSAKGTDSLIADMMRHLHSREYLGKAVIVCDDPVVTLSAARKQWLKISRVIQKQRASTLNADKILKYTHAIAHMQHCRFSAKEPIEDPDSDVYFLAPNQIGLLPIKCYSLYVTSHIDAETIEDILQQLPDAALVVDYDHGPWEHFGSLPKAKLEEKVSSEWRNIIEFLTLNDIDISDLSTGNIQDIEAMDDALDTLLGISYPFLQVADTFQHALETARPLRLNKETRREYDAFSLLAHRVQALSLENFTQRFLETYNEDDTFFLYDLLQELKRRYEDSPKKAIGDQILAGRTNLADAFRRLYMGRLL